MYITGAESSVPAYVTTDGLDEHQDCSAVGAGQWWRDFQLSSLLLRQRFHLGETEKRSIVHNFMAYLTGSLPC